MPVSVLRERMERCGGFWCRNGLGAAILTGIEAALWDLKGKLLNKPAYQLLLEATSSKAVHSRLAAYATGGPSNYPPSQLLKKIDHYLSLGFKNFKIGAGYLADDLTPTDKEDSSSDNDEGINVARSKSALTPAAIVEQEREKFRLMREHVGPSVGIAMDAHMANRQPGSVCWDAETALAICQAIEPYRPLFLEEPLPYEDVEGYALLSRSTPVPIAGGECLTSVGEFELFANALDICQPDAAFTTGMLGCVQVSRLFAGKQLAFHSWGAGGALMQNIHAAFACSNTAIVELVPSPGPLHTQVYGDSLRFEDGCILPPLTPGLGLRLTDDLKRRFPFVPGSGEFNDVPGKILEDAKLGVDWPGLLRFHPTSGQPFVDKPAIPPPHSDHKSTSSTDLSPSANSSEPAPKSAPAPNPKPNPKPEPAPSAGSNPNPDPVPQPNPPTPPSPTTLVCGPDPTLTLVLVSPSDYKLAGMMASSASLQTQPIRILHPHDHQQLSACLPDADAVLWVWPPDAPTCDDITWTDHSGAKAIGESWSQRASRVRWVHITSHGVDHVPYHRFAPGVAITNSRGAFGHVVAEFVMWGCLHWAKEAEQMRVAQAERRWKAPVVRSLRGSCIGIIGYGSIGSKVGSMARAMGMRVSALRRRRGGASTTDTGAKDTSATEVEMLFGTAGLQKLLQQSDYVCIAAPLTPDTRAMIGATELALMKSTSILINVGRGEIVDEEALLTCLRARSIRGAVLEVFAQEPLPSSHPFYGMDNVVVAAHCADNTSDQLSHCLHILEDNVARFVQGESLRNIVDREAGY